MYNQVTAQAAATVVSADDLSVGDEKRMRLRYTGVCRVCGVALPAKAEAIYERPSKTVRCVAHDGVAQEQPADETPEAEVASLHKREERIRTKRPKLGGLILAITDDPQSTKAWDVGAVGEEMLGTRLTDYASDALLVLHDRRIPGSRANIDHLAVTPAGVFVIDAKKYKGRASRLRARLAVTRSTTAMMTRA